MGCAKKSVASEKAKGPQVVCFFFEVFQARDEFGCRIAREGITGRFGNCLHAAPKQKKKQSLKHLVTNLCYFNTGQHFPNVCFVFV